MQETEWIEWALMIIRTTPCLHPLLRNLFIGVEVGRGEIQITYEISMVLDAPSYVITALSTLMLM